MQARSSGARIVVSIAVVVGASKGMALDTAAQPVSHGSQVIQGSQPPRRCGDWLSFQILLDQQGFSPGEIDGRAGNNTKHALSALQRSRDLRPTGEPDCETWRALGGESSPPLLTTYTITPEDLKGPFEPQIPRDLLAQAKLPTLDYQSPLERLAERFHASPALLQQLNRGTATVAGQSIRVPSISPFDADMKAFNRMADDVTLFVSREESAVRVTSADGKLILFAPATTGSDHDPLPSGKWEVTGIEWHPAFHYNPDLFWDAKPTDTKATIKPGPNNPVGVVWIGLNLEHYGIHGTPEPSRIGRMESHGCVRLTNWDAARLASMVRAGTLVVFR